MSAQSFAVPSGSVDITAGGRTHPIGRAGRRRILQAFLTQTLGYTCDDAHDEMKNFERSVSDAMVERIDSHLRESAQHSRTVPPTQGRPVRPAVMKLTDAESGRELAVVRVSEAAPAMLAYLAELGLAAETRLTVRRHRSHSDVTTIQILGHAQEIHLGSVASDALWVASARAI